MVQNKVARFYGPRCTYIHTNMLIKKIRIAY